ncbi:ROK family transcriptional regulator [Agromyces marinus]|uniref:ROK family transcriptional regulator n=1 Tax=Agromyces marinus TaxID=1389020 RepID=UPI003305BC21
MIDRSGDGPGAGTSDGVHRRNLARILGLVHYRGPLSRAWLTALTGLNRSTVAALAARLVDLGLAREQAPDQTSRAGRPSPVIAVDPDLVAVAVNPEVDAVTIAAVGLGGAIAARVRVDVADLVTPERTATLVAEVVREWRGGELAHARFVGAGLAVPGLVRASDGLVRFAPHLKWRDAQVRELVEAATGLPTAAGNDATLGAIAEHRFGAGRGVDDLVYLNGGASGIGGGLVVHGRPVLGAGGFAGEFGQNRPGIDDAGDRRAVGGVLEDEVGRSRLLGALGLRSADEPALAAAIARAVASGDAEVVAELDRQRRILATAIANAVNVLNPSRVILGGFLATLAEQDSAAMRAAVAGQAMPAAAEDLLLVVAALGEDRLLVGAAELAFAPLLADPCRSRTERRARSERMPRPAVASAVRVLHGGAFGYTRTRVESIRDLRVEIVPDGAPPGAVSIRSAPDGVRPNRSLQRPHSSTPRERLCPPPPSPSSGRTTTPHDATPATC